MSASESWSLQLADFLLSPSAQRALSDLSPQELLPESTLSTLTKLRGTFAAQEAGALLDIARLRSRAAAKFPHANRMYFTGEALEQATAWPVALHRARWIDRQVPPGSVLDLGCGIGGDSLALAQFRHVIAYEVDPIRMRFAQANAMALNLNRRIEFRHADWTEDLACGSLPQASAAFVDPSRRVQGRRVFSLHQMRPALASLLKLRERFPNLAVKVMPGVKEEELPDGCEVEFISHEGVCKEAVLWFGVLTKCGRWASVHSQGGWHSLCANERQPPIGSIAPGSVLYEPDPAVIRAGAFWELCELLEAHLFDPRIAYLVSDSLQETPFASAFLVLEVHPFNLRRLNQRLRSLKVCSVELKKRGAPFEPESLRPRLTLSTTGTSAVVIFTRIQDAPTMIIAQRP